MAKKRTTVQDLIFAGRGMANALYNITQMNVLNPAHAESARESFREWDVNLNTYEKGNVKKPVKRISDAAAKPMQ